jgi:disulfide bond formation protein DsbB
MPDWFALDRWFPDLFEVRNLCTYTPEVLFGLSMAESLLLAAAGVAAYAVVSLVAVSRAMATS